MVFEELYKGKPVDSYRRYLQRRFVTAAIESVGSSSANSDGRTLIYGKLLEIKKKAEKEKSSDAATQAHWQGIAKMIEDASYKSSGGAVPFAQR
jgi:hypothetical protein